MMSHFIKVADPNPGWRGPAILGWAGMRGVVSLAAALSIPVMLSDGSAFPFRNLILFITFVVILVTLVFQGLTLPWLIRKLHVKDRSTAYSEKEQERIIQMKLAKYTLAFLHEHPDPDLLSNPYIGSIVARLRTDLAIFEVVEEGEEDDRRGPLIAFQKYYIEVLNEQRKLLAKINTHSEFDEELIRKYLGLIDLEEYKVRKKMG
jgi:hypothetical protein